MPRQEEFAAIIVNGRQYRDWQTVEVKRSARELTSTFSFSAASPIESSPNWAGLKLAIGDKCLVIMAGQPVIAGRINVRQPAYDAQQHGLQVAGAAVNQVIARATANHKPGEFKNYNLSQIANAALKPHGIKFVLRGETSGAEKPFERVNVQVGETVFSLIERLCRFRNIHMFDDREGNIVGYRLGRGSSPIADLEEGRNIKSASAAFNYQGSFSEVEATGQRPGNNDHWGEDASDVAHKVSNPAVTQFVPLTLVAEMPGDKSDMKMRAEHEMALNISTQVNIQVVVQGWQRDDGSLWLDNVGKTVTLYSPMILTNDRAPLAIYEVTSSQSEAGTLTNLTLVLPEALNGRGEVEGTPNIPNMTGRT